MRRSHNDNIPIKIGGWDGKFVLEKPAVSGKVPVQKSYQETPKSTKLPMKNGNEYIIPVEVIRSSNGNNNNSNSVKNSGTEGGKTFANGNQFYGYTREPEVLPVVWDGKFVRNQNPIRYVPDRNRSDETKFFGYSTEPVVLPVQWDGKFQTNPNDVRIKPERNQSDTMDYADSRNFITKEEREELDREIAASKVRGDDVVWSNDRNFGKSGWNGKFVVDPNDVRIKPERNRSDESKFFGYSTEPVVLPVQWDGKFQTNPNDVRIKPERNQSDTMDYADSRNFITKEEREELDREIAASKARGDDVVWSNDRNFGKSGWNGKFVVDPNDVRIKPERNRSDESKFFGYSTEPEVLPVQWDGHFQLDPNDVRIKPERNASDVRDYAEARNFIPRN